MRKIYSYASVVGLREHIEEKDFSFIVDYVLHQLMNDDVKRRIKVIFFEKGDCLWDIDEIIDGYDGGLLRIEFSKLEYMNGYFIMHHKHDNCIIIFNEFLLNTGYLEYFKKNITQ